MNHPRATLLTLALLALATWLALRFYLSLRAPLGQLPHPDPSITWWLAAPSNYPAHPCARGSNSLSLAVTNTNERNHELEH